MEIRRFASVPCLSLAFLAVAVPPAAARSPISQESVSASDSPVLALSQLPPEGRATYRLIREGGPFPFEKDGSVFGNRERLLPLQKHGFYREYTVATPATRDRGAKRIVCGGPAVRPVVCYYTADHYASFRRLEGTGD